jgi:hypothetical protein
LSTFSTNSMRFFTQIPKIDIPKTPSLTSTFPPLKQMTTFNPVSYFKTPSYTSSLKLYNPTFSPSYSTFTSAPKIPSYQSYKISRY